MPFLPNKTPLLPPLPGQVPVLVDGSLEITESPVVAEYVLKKYGSSTGERYGSGTGDGLRQQRHRWRQSACRVSG